MNRRATTNSVYLLLVIFIFGFLVVVNQAENLRANGSTKQRKLGNDIDWDEIWDDIQTLRTYIETFLRRTYYYLVYLCTRAGGTAGQQRAARYNHFVMSHGWDGFVPLWT